MLGGRYDNMTDMKKLSDAELNRNLEIFFNEDKSYVTVSHAQPFPYL